MQKLTEKEKIKIIKNILEGMKKGSEKYNLYQKIKHKLDYIIIKFDYHTYSKGINTTAYNIIGLGWEEGTRNIYIFECHRGMAGNCISVSIDFRLCKEPYEIYHFVL